MIIGIVGMQGNGKTLIMSILLYLAHLSGKTLITNYDIKIPHIKITSAMFSNKKKFLEKVEKEKSKKNGLCFGLDEIHLELDSRTALKNSKKSFILTQARKVLEENGYFIYTTQFFNQIDKRLRLNTSYILKTEKIFTIYPKEFKIKVSVFKNDGDYLKPTGKIFLINPTEIFEKKLYERFELIDISS